MSTYPKKSNKKGEAMPEINLRRFCESLPDFKTKALLPVFEALTNSFHAIEEKFGNIRDGKISINIFSDGAKIEDEEFLGDIQSFEIIDNGIGFTEKNMKSFNTIFSDSKQLKGGKGIGHCTWLKAFERAEIKSVFKEDNMMCERSFVFDFSYVDHTGSRPTHEKETSTVLTLSKFQKKYAKAISAYKRPRTIARKIIEHNLSAFASGEIPEIILNWGVEPISLNNLFHEIVKDSKSEIVMIGKYSFTITHFVLGELSTNDKTLAVLCAHGWDVLSYSLDKTLDIQETLRDENGNTFRYLVRMSGSYLDEHVNTIRTEFDLPNSGISSFVDSDTSIGLEDLKFQIEKASRLFLKNQLSRIEVLKKEKVEKYVAEVDPSLRSVLKYHPEVFKNITNGMDDRQISEVLYKFKGVTEFETRKESLALLEKQKGTPNKEKITEILSKINDVQKDELARYVTHRKMILQHLDQLIRKNTGTGKTEYESEIHNLFFPMKKDSTELDIDAMNLWILDERLVFHPFAVSDKKLKEYTDSTSSDRPDTLILTECDDDEHAKTVAIIEYKRALRDVYDDESPKTQLVRMVGNIIEKNIDVNGRPILVEKLRTQFFCYALCDFTTKLKQMAEEEDWVPVVDNILYYAYHKKYNSHIYIMNWNRVVQDAEKRNYALFRKLGLHQVDHNK